MDYNDPVELTYWLLGEGRTARGGHTAAQYRVLGVKPFSPYWKMIGKTITRQQYHEFLKARDVYSPKTAIIRAKREKKKARQQRATGPCVSPDESLTVE